MINIEIAKPVQKKLKLLFYGPSGSGKTFAALSFPRVLLVDAESGADLYAGRPGIPDFFRTRIKTLTELEEVVRHVEADAGKTYGTLVIDPITVFHGVEKNVLSANNTKDLGYREWAKLNNRMNSLYNRLTGLPVHVVIIAREAVEYAGEGVNLRKVGVKPDADKNLVYNLDFVLRFNADHSAQVEKSRGSAIAQHVPAVTWTVFEPISTLYLDGQPQAYEDEEVAAEREADSLQNREVAERYVAFWRSQGLTDADLLKALNVSRLSEWTRGKAQADETTRAYITAQTPAAPKNGGGYGSR